MGLRLYSHITSNQRAFNAVCRHLAKQKRRAFDDYTQSCVYKADNGDRCAVGGIMPIKDAAYAEAAFGGTGVDLIGLNLDNVSLELLGELQEAHDETYTGGVVAQAEALQQRLVDIADAYGLNASAVGLITEWQSDT